MSTSDLRCDVQPEAQSSREIVASKEGLKQTILSVGWNRLPVVDDDELKAVIIRSRFYFDGPVGRAVRDGVGQ